MPMKIDILTLFPGMFDAVLSESILKRAQEKRKVVIRVHDLRAYSRDKHRKADDRPFGGGSGMVMSAEPIFRAVEAIIEKVKSEKQKVKSEKKKGKRGRVTVVLLCPQGRPFTQALAKKMARYEQMLLICGRYEGVDERVRNFLADEEISIGDYVLTGGELPAMVVVDAVVRLIPGVLGDKNSLNCESFEGNLLEYAQYTRPAVYKDMRVPPVLLSGDHAKIAEWRQKEALRRTLKRRPDLLQKKDTKKKAKK